MESRRRPRMRLTYKQLKLLVKFMGDNPLVAKGVDYRTAMGKHYHDAKWSELADLMNAQENGMTKSPREWNRYWKDLKYSIKKKVHASKTNNKKSSLSNIQQIIYNEMCMNTCRKDTGGDEETHSYLQIPENDNDQDNYEVEYLEDSSCDEAEFNSIPKRESVTEFIEDSSLCLKELESELNQRNESSLDYDHPSDDFISKWLGSKVVPPASGTPSILASKPVKLNDPLENEQFPDSIYNEPKLISRMETVVDDIALKKDIDTNDTKLTNIGLNSNVLIEIRDQLKELVALQKDRAKSSQRMAAAHERRAILEERRVKIEEKRLKMEEQRLAFEERRMEVLKRRTLAEERLATAAERRNDLKEAGMDVET